MNKVNFLKIVLHGFFWIPDEYALCVERFVRDDVLRGNHLRCGWVPRVRARDCTTQETQGIP